MKKVTVSYYEATDGKRFNKESDAKKYQKVVDEVVKFYKTIPKTPDDIEFMNGTGYIQHKPGTYKKMETLLVTLFNEYYDLKGRDRHTKMNYVLGRMVDDGDMEILNGLVSRLMSINPKTDREYGQPYYANNPSKSKGDQINKTS